MISYESNVHADYDVNKCTDDWKEGQISTDDSFGSYIETRTYDLILDDDTEREQKHCVTKTTGRDCVKSHGCDKNCNIPLAHTPTSEYGSDDRTIYDTYPRPHRGQRRSYRPTTSLDRYRIEAACVAPRLHRGRTDDVDGNMVDTMRRLDGRSAGGRSATNCTARQGSRGCKSGHIGNRIELMTKIERRENPGHTGSGLSRASHQKDSVRELIHGYQTVVYNAGNAHSKHTRADMLTSAETNQLEVKEKRNAALPFNHQESGMWERHVEDEHGCDGTNNGNVNHDNQPVERTVDTDYSNATNMYSFNNETHMTCATKLSYGTMYPYNCVEKYDTTLHGARNPRMDNREPRPMTVGDYTRVRLVHPVRHASSQPAIHLPCAGACKGRAATMTTTLPRITPASTPLPPGLAQRSHSCTSLYSTRPPSNYGAYPPKELSSSMDFLQMPNRVNPLHPPPPRKRINWSWETTDQHFENEKRRLLMQKREHTRYHSAWGKPFYGAPAEREAYRRHFREVLKQQMHDKDIDKKVQMKKKAKETETAIQQDVDCRRNDAHDHQKRNVYLMQYRDGNKDMMERLWTANKQRKVAEDRVDCERLRYNPINWSCSLK